MVEVVEVDLRYWMWSSCLFFGDVVLEDAVEVQLLVALLQLVVVEVLEVEDAQLAQCTSCW